MMSKSIYMIVACFSLVLTAQAEFDHSAFTTVLQAHVNDQGQVNYQALKADRTDLDAYIQSLEQVSEATSKAWNSEEKMAFYINAYNAKTLQVIIDHYPIKPHWKAKLLKQPLGIRHIFKVWDKYPITLLGSSMSLNHIEHEVLRKKYTEPRVHMGLVCASVGCPFLRNDAYTGTQLDVQLDEQTRQFLADPSKFRIDEQASKVWISPIFEWFSEDFVKTATGRPALKSYEATHQAILEFIFPFRPDTEANILASRSFDVETLDYDWGLNEQP